MCRDGLPPEEPGTAGLQGRDYILRDKPIDTPYGPYIDVFSLDQHMYGLFELIRAKVQDVAAASHDGVDPIQRD